MKCKWCDDVIEDGEECDRCWELRTRIDDNPELVSKMTASKPAAKPQLIALRDALLAWKDKDGASAAENLIDILSRPADINSRAWYEKEDYGTRFIISAGEVLEI